MIASRTPIAHAGPCLARRTAGRPGAWIGGSVDREVSRATPHRAAGRRDSWRMLGGVVCMFLFITASAHDAHAAELLDAARAGDIERVQGLLEAGADPNQADPDGVTALHIAASKGRIEIAKALIAAGADVDLAEYDGDTPLVNASAFGHLDVVELLIARRADIDVESSQGYTPVQLARREGHSEVVRALRTAARRAREAPPSGEIAKSAIGQVLGGSSRASARQYRPGYQRRIAAVIGVNDYVHWPPLAGARADAEKVAAKLRKMGFDEVLELYDRDATRAAILELLGTRLPSVVGEDDLVVIFFAGHGQTETLDDETKRKRGYIIPVDATTRGVFSTAIPMLKLRELTNRLPAKHVYYAMDSCYSGLGFTRGIGLVKPTAKDYISKVTSLRAVQMVTAGGEGEEAIERDGEGVFTRSFLDALDGEADANGDGYVTATEIGAYVAPRVTNETDAKQSPQSGRLEGEGEIAFAVGASR